MLGVDLMHSLAQQGFAPAPMARTDADITDPEAVRACIGARNPHMIINCAAMTAVDACEDEPEKAFAVNRDGAAIVAAAAADLKAPVIHISTDYVFDGRSSVPYPETHPSSPLGVYGRSKQASEIAVAAANPAHYILRTSWLCGAHGKNFVKTILQLSETHKELRVVSDQLGSPTFTHDLAGAIAQIAKTHFNTEPGAPPYGIYHITNTGYCSWHYFAKTILKTAGKDNITVHPINSEQARIMLNFKAPRPAYSVLDCSKAAATFGICLPTWQDSLQVFMTSLSAI